MAPLSTPRAGTLTQSGWGFSQIGLWNACAGSTPGDPQVPLVTVTAGIRCGASPQSKTLTRDRALHLAVNAAQWNSAPIAPQDGIDLLLAEAAERLG